MCCERVIRVLVASIPKKSLLSNNPAVTEQILRFYPGLEMGMPFRDFLEYVTWGSAERISLGTGIGSRSTYS